MYPPPRPARRALLRGALGLGAAGALAACGHDAATVRTSGAVTLSLWTHDPGYQAFFSKGLREADRRTDYTYQLAVTRAGAADLVTKLLAQAVAGRGTPDVMGFVIEAFPRMLRGDIAPRLLHDFTADIAAVPGLADDLLPARTAPYSKDGKIYALDSDTPMVVYYYRDDLFTEYGLPADTPTWEEFAELGARVHQDHGASLCVVATGSDVGQVVASFQMLLYQRGGALFDADQRLVLDSPEAEEALTFLCEGLRGGFVIDISDYYGAAMQTALKQGKVIGLPMATWYKSYGLMPNVPDQSGRWRIRALPRFANGGGRTATLGGTGFGVIKDKANTRAATEFLLNTWLTRDGQVRRYTDIGYLPTRRSVYQDPRLHALKDTFCGGQRLLGLYRELLPEVPAVHQSPDQSILYDVLGGNLLRAYRGDLTPRQALKQTTEDFRDQAGR
ncbi:ABC transporter substrate-binding protein [Streptomyces sp. ME19-01-6]|uniref:ABC transporter substrate-binding protein n=1 Tax=Streptomyces sp. ME19-01-6 TaxID=3028686 RepID=UPI0029ABDB43|nr:extracellular solute-binding protein [Streptomyces sp. ME19-01-6]MDX3233331.1 extracellular solute-binding protein [Streptomyces sp. ME19-01-6]